MIRILIVDDPNIACRRLQRMVADEPDMTVVGVATNAEEMLAFARTQPCHVVVTDISMPGWSELDALKELKRERPQLPVLVLTAHAEDQYLLRAVTLGARGYLATGCPPEELVQAIRTVVTGGKYISPTFAEYGALNPPLDTRRPAHEMLSKREHEVLCLIASGKAAQEIAAELTLSVKTVHTYRTRTLAKMAMRRNAELMHYAISHRLVETPQQNGSRQRGLIPAPTMRQDSLGMPGSSELRDRRAPRVHREA
jgi:two-component system, NarL family, invasion response regulator UvrY